jgi:cephalosporin-C deacetylase-like acetyl esterase
MMLKVLIFVVLIFSVCLGGNNLAIYQEFLNDNAPTILETVEEYTQDGVYVHKLKFLSRVSAGQNVVIYGILCKPVGDGPYPGLLNVHGGGGYADQMFAQVFDWAKLGYVAFCQDQPGICNGTYMRSSGPFTSRSNYTVDPDATYSRLFDGVVAGLNGLRMVRSQPETDCNNVGITGGSWGGYMTTMMSGLAQDRAKASFSVYGCGYYDVGSAWRAEIEALDEDDRIKWLDALDAGRKASQIQSNFFLTSPTNDWYFWPSAMMATFGDITSPKNFAIAANAMHYLTLGSGFAGGTDSTQRRTHRTYMEIQWMNYHLKGIGDPFGSCTPGTVTRSGDNARVEFTYTGVNPEEEALIYYAYGETPFRSNYWRSVPVTSEGNGTYSGLIPVYETEQPILWYGSARDLLGADLREYVCSTTYQTIDPLTLGFAAAERRDEHFTEDFEGAVDRWRLPYAKSYPGNYSYGSTGAHSGSKGIRFTGEQTLRCDGMRGEAFNKFADGIKMWVKNPGGTDFTIQLMCEEYNNTRWYWSAQQSDPGPDWMEISIPWSSFTWDSSLQPPMDLLSNRLAQMRVKTPAGCDLYIDDIGMIIRDPNQAYDPTPAGGAKDVAQDIVFSWTPGEHAETGHDVYLGMVYQSVDEATTASTEYRGRFDVNNYDAGTFEAFDLNAQYYWRVDEVSGSNIYKGQVWRFEIEGYDIGSNKITVTASEEEAGRPATKIIDGSGLDSSELLHDNVKSNNWTTEYTTGGGYTNPHPGTVPGNLWVAFEFDRTYRLGDMWIWNNNWNDTLGNYTIWGLRNVTIEYSTTGGANSSEWTKLGDFEFAKADGTTTYAHNTEINFGAAEAKYVCITTHDTAGTWNAPSTGKHGLAEVRFFKQAPETKATNPTPTHEANDIASDVVLQWNAGELAASHNVFLSIDANEVTAADTGSQAFKGNAADNYFATSDLEPFTTYYWMVEEVNGVRTWPGDVWSFTTKDNVTGQAATAANSINWTHTISSVRDGIIVVGVATRDTTSADMNIVTAKIGRENLIAVTGTEKEIGDGPFSKTQMFSLDQDSFPPNGDQTISITFAGTVDDICGTAITLNHVKQQGAEATGTSAHASPSRAMYVSLVPESESTEIVSIVSCAGDTNLTPQNTIKRIQKNTDDFTTAMGTVAIQQAGYTSQKWTPDVYGAMTLSAAAFATQTYYGPADLSLLGDNWLNTGPDMTQDIYPDQEINFKDFAIMANAWLE